MQEKLVKEINNLSNKEATKVFEDLKDIFKGGVVITNPENKDEAMLNYYRATQMMGMEK